MSNRMSARCGLIVPHVAILSTAGATTVVRMVAPRDERIGQARACGYTVREGHSNAARASIGQVIPQGLI
jgi:hypothetical protein